MWRISAILVFSTCLTLVNCQPKVPCYFIFGDSLSDPGNNNFLFTLSKSNYPPYGVDFPGGVPTGRFTNALNSVDYIARFLGFERFIQPYRSEADTDILSGVNFASGSAGILKETSYFVGDRVWMDRQLQNYGTTISRLQSLVEGSVANYLNKCLYTVNIGTNDYINNYFSPLFFPLRPPLTADEFASLLIVQYRRQLQAIYDSGARKVAIFGLGPLGCIEYEKTKSFTTQCVELKNQAVQVFNKKLVTLVDELNTNLLGANFTFVDVYAIQSTIFPSLITNSTCCQLSVSFMCKPFSLPCANRDSYAFMDGIHPTDVVNKQIATISYNTTQTPTFVYPINISQLVSN